MGFGTCVNRSLAPVLATLLRKNLRRKVRLQPALPDAVERLLTAYRQGHIPDPGEGFDGWSRYLLVHCYRCSGAHYFQSLLRVHRIAIKQLHAPVWRCRRSAGALLDLNIANVAEWSVFMLGEHDRGVGYWLDHFANEQTVFVDVGANVGIFTLRAARLLATSGQVIAFEPNPDARSRLLGNLSINGFLDQVTVSDCALGEDNATLTLCIPAENEGGASFEGSEVEGKRIDVEVLRFDSWWRRADMPAISLIKVDVEGHEMAVLRGMQDMLHALKPVLIVEVTFRDGDITYFVESVKTLGYRVRQILHSPPYSRPVVLSGRGRVDLLCEPA